MGRRSQFAGGGGGGGGLTAGVNVLPTTGIIQQTQGGTAGAPAAETPIVIQPRSTTDGLTKAPFAVQLGSFAFNPGGGNIFDEVLDIGYNVNNAQPALPVARFSIESDYADGPGPTHLMEMHGQYASRGDGAGTTYRWLTGSFRGYSTFRGTAGLNWKDGSGADNGYVSFSEALAAQATLTLATAGVTMFTGGFANLSARGLWTITGDIAQSDVAPNDMTLLPQRPFAGATGANRQSGQFIVDLGAPIAGGVETNFYVRRAGNASAVMALRADGNLFLSNIPLATPNFLNLYYDGATEIQGNAGTMFVRNSVSGADIQFTATGAGGVLVNNMFYAVTNGAQLFNSNAAALGSGVGVLGVGKATTNPTTNPSGVVAYSEATSGALKVRDALGADSNISGGFFSQAMADAPQTVSAANSANKYYRATGANTGVRALTISLPPSKGTMIVVRNDCTAFGITVQFSSGAATATILPGVSAVIVGDGANAFIMMAGT